MTGLPIRTKRSKLIVEEWDVRLHLRKRFAGDTEPPFWQIDAYLPNGEDHHAVGDTPTQALIELGTYLAKKGVGYK